MLKDVDRERGAGKVCVGARSLRAFDATCGSQGLLREAKSLQIPWNNDFSQKFDLSGCERSWSILTFHCATNHPNTLWLKKKTTLPVHDIMDCLSGAQRVALLLVLLGILCGWVGMSKMALLIYPVLSRDV